MWLNGRPCILSWGSQRGSFQIMIPRAAAALLALKYFNWSEQSVISRALSSRSTMQNKSLIWRKGYFLSTIFSLRNCHFCELMQMQQISPHGCASTRPADIYILTHVYKNLRASLPLAPVILRWLHWMWLNGRSNNPSMKKAPQLCVHTRAHLEWGTGKQRCQTETERGRGD